MMNTIGPMVTAEGRGGWVVEGAHVGGGAMGGAVTGLLAAGIGLALNTFGGDWIFHSTVVILVCIASSVAIAYDVSLPRRSFGFKRQTPRSWRYLLSPRWAAFTSGMDLGLGWSTRVHFASYGLVLISAMASHSPGGGALIGGAFGASRAMFVVWVERVLGFESETLQALAAKERLVRWVDLAAVGQFSALMLIVFRVIGPHFG